MCIHHLLKSVSSILNSIPVVYLIKLFGNWVITIIYSLIKSKHYELWD